MPRPTRERRARDAALPGTAHVTRPAGRAHAKKRGLPVPWHGNVREGAAWDARRSQDGHGHYARRRAHAKKEALSALPLLVPFTVNTRSSRRRRSCVRFGARQAIVSPQSRLRRAAQACSVNVVWLPSPVPASHLPRQGPRADSGHPHLRPIAEPAHARPIPSALLQPVIAARGCLKEPPATHQGPDRVIVDNRAQAAW